MSTTVSFEGTIVSVENICGNEAVYVLGTVDGSFKEYYIIPDKDTLNKIKMMGMGIRVSGRGIIVSENPLLIKPTIINIG